MRSTISAEFRNWRTMKQLRAFDKTTPTYWLARLVGFRGSTFERQFVKPVIDFSEANSKLSRYVMYYWHIEPGLYEGVFNPNFDRQWVIADHGDVQFIEKHEAERWLSDFLENQSLKHRESE